MSNKSVIGGALSMIVSFAYASAAISGNIGLLVVTSLLLMVAAFISGLIKGADD